MRNGKIDNCKGLLIILVVLGHILETGCGGRIGAILYKVIYAFHMPAFIFLMGIVAKPNKNRIVKNIGIYTVFQILYTAFNAVLVGEHFTVYFRRPYWILWFCLVEIYYGLALILMNKIRCNTIYTFIFAVLISLAGGYVERIGYTLSLSRAITFFPYYLGGMLFKNSYLRSKQVKPIIAISILSEGYVSLVNTITPEMMYGSYSYTLPGYNPIIKSILYFIGFVSVISLYMIMPSEDDLIINKIGRNTLPVYLLHGFVVMVIKKYNPFVFQSIINMMLAVAIACLIVYVLSCIEFRNMKA